MGRPSSSFQSDGVWHKECPRCHVIKPHADYAKNVTRAHGIQSRCKSCQCDTSKKWNSENSERHRSNAKRWKDENKERVAEVTREYYVKNRDQKLAKSHERYVANREKLIRDRRDFRIRNIDDERRKMREYCAKNILMFLAKNSRRRALMKSVVHSFDHEFMSLVEIEAYDLAKIRSGLTGLNWHVDHIVPLVSPKRHSLNGGAVPPRGFCGPLFPIVQGFHNEWNLAVIPASSNLTKSNKRWPNMP